MDRVFCDQCKHIRRYWIDKPSEKCGHQCSHPANVFEKQREDSWLTEGAAIKGFRSSPKLINMHNDCSRFESKNDDHILRSEGSEQDKEELIDSLRFSLRELNQHSD